MILSLPPTILAPLFAIERHLAEVLSSLELPNTLHEAMAYAALGPGKRIRPLLVWHSAAAVSGDSAAAPSVRPGAESPLPACAAIELIHAFSLVHDDLPALDNDDLRRGRPTLHRQTSEAMAILAGDAMLAAAFATLALPVGGQSLSPQLATALAADLSRATLDMIGGQVHDTLGGLPESLPPLDRVAAIHRLKTGALIAAACRMGARCGGASSQTVGALEGYGSAIGLMFQIVDDLLDVEQSDEHAGKRTGKDVAAGKLTYPSVLGAAGAREEIGRLETVAIDHVRPLGTGAQPLMDLATWLAHRTR